VIVHTQTPTTAHGVKPSRAAPQIRSLLVIDDDDNDLEIIAATLGSAFPDADVTSTSNAAQASALCRTHPFDCLLLDYNMPRIDGLALTAEIRADHPHLPIVLMTSVGDEMLAALALRSGASDYIPKSRINADSIRRSVDRSIHTADQARLIDEQRNELETFAYTLAHDFKQPIRQITTFTEMISTAIEEGQAGGMVQHLAFLNTAARRLSKLVDVMSQYTLLNQPPEIDDVDLTEVVERIRASIEPYLADRGAILRLKGATPVLRGNDTLLAQVLQNLILNGLQYNKSTTPCVALSTQTRGGDCVIEVRDNGLGIDPDYIGEIFKPLVRLHTATEYPGSGLGLTLARKAVLAQGGAIWCESTPGEGSTFYVQLPLASERPSSPN
jgi:signal transduction histidine kinase